MLCNECRTTGNECPATRNECPKTCHECDTTEQMVRMTCNECPENENEQRVLTNECLFQLPALCSSLHFTAVGDKLVQLMTKRELSTRRREDIINMY